MVISAVSKLFASVFGTRNDRLVKAYYKRVEQINELESKARELTDAALRHRTDEFKSRCAEGETIADLMPEVLAIAREVMDRAVGIRSIFKPESGFDPESLPVEVRHEYHRIDREIQALNPVEVPGCETLVPAWMQVEIPNVLYQAIRDLHPKSRPPFRARPFDVQLVGGMVLGEGRISEMKTGEGKTIVAPLACYVACVEQLQCHVVTVNDYLVQRDRDWVFPFYYWLGLTVGAIHPFHMQTSEKKKEAYECQVVYGTNAEFGFDYLRDNMKLSADEQVQKYRDFCIIDEVDSILIDEARTPLIISGPAHDDAPRYGMADGVARHLMQKQKVWDAADVQVQQCIMKIKGIDGDIRNTRDKTQIQQMREQQEKFQEKLPELEAIRDQHTQYFEVEREKKAAHLTHDGVAEAQKIAGIGSFYVGNNMDVPHLLENALRAYAVYTRDKDYVVQGGEVVIVDENTGRLMVGRQWSDGLHQAIESKERVKIKQETQTLATVTIQNFFKLYKRLAGMTGTAITEAQEFNDIYNLDVVCVPTNLPVIRNDVNDIIYLSVKDKWDAILEEIKRHHDIGRPVLVGTTSVETSEMLSGLLNKRHGIKHQVLNAKQHEHEASVVLHAGELGAVMIATNMAGRGTDIKLSNIERATLVHHWQQRNILSSDATADMDDQTLLAKVYQHLSTVLLGKKTKELEAESQEVIRLRLLRYWVKNEGWRIQWPTMQWWEKVLLYKFFMTPPWHDADKIEAMPEGELLAVLDQLPNFMYHRLEIFNNIEEMGGLHIVGTERHESRRIDNQLRGRAGRQGDRGSSRFFISLEDDLMKIFAGKTTLTALSKLGMKEGDAIEHRWLTRSVERAQSKVENRNYEIRKSLLEYDEVMEYQRGGFYSIRQEVLDGKNIDHVVFDYIGDAIDDAVHTYLAPEYVKKQVAEWCHATLDVSVDTSRIHLDDLQDLQKVIRRESKIEARQIVEVTLGEYMSDEMPPADWDLRGLSQWAMSRFSVDLKQNQLRRMNFGEVEARLSEAAEEQIERKDLSGVSKFIDTEYAQKDLVNWAQTKFDLELDVSEISTTDLDAVTEDVLTKARKAYARREVTYPVEFTLEMIFTAAQDDGQWASQELCHWAKKRYGLDWTADQVMEMTGAQMFDALTAEAELWISGDKLEKQVDQVIAENADLELLSKWIAKYYGREITAKELEADNKRDLVLDAGFRMHRAELTQLERYVLLQILDNAWKDHLYAMDQLKDSVGLRGFAECDPKLEYKREGSGLFQEMQSVVRDRVTDLIFRARLTPDTQAKSVYDQQQTRHDEAGNLLASAASSQGSNEQQADLHAAEYTGGGGDDDAGLTRHERRAKAAKRQRENASSNTRTTRTRKKRRK